MVSMNPATLTKPPPGRAARLDSPVTLADLQTRPDEDGMPSDELTPADVAREFDVSAATVRRWETRGILKPTRKLPGSKHRRYSRADIDAFHRKLETGSEGDTTA
jgi:hypothetical protein